MTPHDVDGLWQSMLAYAQRLVRSHCRPMPAEDSLDIAQDALLALLRREKLHGPLQDPHVWLIPVVRNLAAERRRRRRRRREQAFGTDEHGEGREAAGREDRCFLEGALDDLSPGLTATERLIALALADGETRTGIAAGLGVSRRLIAEAVTRISKKMSKYGEQDEE